MKDEGHYLNGHMPSYFQGVTAGGDTHQCQPRCSLEAAPAGTVALSARLCSGCHWNMERSCHRHCAHGPSPVDWQPPPSCPLWLPPAASQLHGCKKTTHYTIKYKLLSFSHFNVKYWDFFWVIKNLNSVVCLCNQPPDSVFKCFGVSLLPRLNLFVCKIAQIQIGWRKSMWCGKKNKWMWTLFSKLAKDSPWTLFFTLTRLFKAFHWSSGFIFREK